MTTTAEPRAPLWKTEQERKYRRKDLVAAAEIYTEVKRIQGMAHNMSYEYEADFFLDTEFFKGLKEIKKTEKYGDFP